MNKKLIKLTSRISAVIIVALGVKIFLIGDYFSSSNALKATMFLMVAILMVTLIIEGHRNNK